jgi:hypothetical protein
MIDLSIIIDRTENGRWFCTICDESKDIGADFNNKIFNVHCDFKGQVLMECVKFLNKYLEEAE